MLFYARYEVSTDMKAVITKSKQTDLSYRKARRLEGSDRGWKNREKTGGE